MTWTLFKYIRAESIEKTQHMLTVLHAMLWDNILPLTFSLQSLSHRKKATPPKAIDSKETTTGNTGAPPNIVCLTDAAAAELEAASGRRRGRSRGRPASLGTRLAAGQEAQRRARADGRQRRGPSAPPQGPRCPPC